MFVNTAFKAKQNLTTLFQKEGFDTTTEQFAVMGALIGKDGITQKELCQISHKNESNLTRILKGMEGKGLIYRQTGKDARSRNVYLSDKGQTLFISLAPIAESYMSEVLGGLSEQEKATLAKLVLHIRNNL
ncbi:MAG: MarR family transcriptional regulator [Defluviitaleaceae bacterium]|nr:MarR family transcriptional regulator [Defluviitaleaceae bacterium]